MAKCYSARQLKKNHSSVFVVQTCFRMPELNHKAFLAESADFKLLSGLVKELKNSDNEELLKMRLTHFYCLFNSFETAWSNITLPKAFYFLKKYPPAIIVNDFLKSEERFYLKHPDLLKKDCLPSFFHEKMREFYYEWATTLCYTKLFKNTARTRLTVGSLDKKQGSVYWEVDLSRLGITDIDAAKRFFETHIFPLYQQNLDKLFCNLKWSALYPHPPKMEITFINTADSYDEEMFC